MIKVLTIKQPWAWLIMEGIKDIENRSWKTDLRGKILIHASKQFDKVAAVKLHRDGVYFPPKLPVGAILGSVEIVDCAKSHSSVWKDLDSSYGFVLKNPIKLWKPYPVRGQLRFWSFDERNLAGYIYDPQEIKVNVAHGGWDWRKTIGP